MSREREENAKRDGERRGETTGGGSWRAEGGERNAQKQLLKKKTDKEEKPVGKNMFGCDKTADHRRSLISESSWRRVNGAKNKRRGRRGKRAAAKYKVATSTACLSLARKISLKHCAKKKKNL